MYLVREGERERERARDLKSIKTASFMINFHSAPASNIFHSNNCGRGRAYGMRNLTSQIFHFFMSQNVYFIFPLKVMINDQKLCLCIYEIGKVNCLVHVIGFELERNN